MNSVKFIASILLLKLNKCFDIPQIRVKIMQKPRGNILRLWELKTKLFGMTYKLIYLKISAMGMGGGGA